MLLLTYIDKILKKQYNKAIRITSYSGGIIMRNIGLIIAGGVGQRMKMNVPKQFIKVLGKPIIIYTLEAFDKNKNIDEMVVVCLQGWEDKLRGWAEEYDLKKPLHIVPGGQTGMELSLIHI